MKTSTHLNHSALMIPSISRSVTIVIPVLNEEGNLERLLSFLEETFQDLSYSLPVLIVDDGSTDKSPQILTQLSKKYSFLDVIRHSERKGCASVWKTALAYVRSDWIIWGQADLESDPRVDIPLLLEACEKGVDAVAGWRQRRGDGKVMASTFANMFCRMIFGLKIHDMNWIKIVRRDLITSLPMDIVTHRYLLAVLAGQGYTIKEVRTPWYSRYSGQSKFGWTRLITSATDFMKLIYWWLGDKSTSNQRVSEIETSRLPDLNRSQVQK